jgi:hypothetical protein
MSILTKILLALVVIAIFPMVFLAAGVLNVNQVWRSKYSEYETRLMADEAKNVLLENGDFKAQTSNYTPPLPADGELGVAQLTAARDRLKMGRSRMWYARFPNNGADPTAQTVSAEVVDNLKNAFEPAGGHGIKNEAQLFLFSNPDPKTLDRSEFDKQNHHYFGEFVVTNVAGNRLTLQPSVPLTAAEWALFAQGGGELVVYDAMPSDQHEVFIGFDEAELRTFLPDSMVEQYWADGKNIDDFPALKADPELSLSVEDGVDPKTKAKIKVFRRPLRSYDLIFRDAALRLVDINNELLIQQKELEYAERAVIKGNEEVARLDEAKRTAEEELKLLGRERMIAEAHLTALNAKVAELTEELKTQLATNKRLAEDIAGRKTASLAPTADSTAGIAAAASPIE